MAARQDHLGPLGRVPHLQDERPHAVSRRVALPRDLLPFGQDRLRPAEVDDDRALLDPVDGAPHQAPLAILELGEDPLSLRLPDPLEDHLLGRLGSDPAELLRGEVDLDRLLELGFRPEATRRLEADLELRVGHRLHDLLLG